MFLKTFTAYGGVMYGAPEPPKGHAKNFHLVPDYGRFVPVTKLPIVTFVH